MTRLMGPHAVSANALSKEIGIHQGTLSRWLRAATVVPMSNDEGGNGRSEKRPQDWTAMEKMRAVLESIDLGNEELGAFLRRNGLHEAQLTEWRDVVVTALSSRGSLPGKKEGKRVRELEKELRRKDKALAEAAALLMLEKKLQVLWGAGDDDTNEESEK